MDHYTRRIVGFGIHAGTVDGRALCRMFNHAIRGLSRPKRLSSDHDPLYRFHQWRANLRVLQVTEVKSVPYVPLSHPFVERLIGTLRRECVDQLLFWSASDLEDKLVAFQDFYNAHRAHASLDGRTPVPIRKDVTRLDRYRLPWSLSDADRGVTSDQRRRWRAGRRARVRRLSRQSRAVRQLHALLMPSRQLRGGLPAHGTRRSNDVGFLRIRHPQARTYARMRRPETRFRGPDFTSVIGHWDVSIEGRVPGAVDLAHAAFADLGGDREGAEAGADVERHWPPGRTGFRAIVANEVAVAPPRLQDVT